VTYVNHIPTHPGLIYFTTSHIRTQGIPCYVSLCIANFRSNIYWVHCLQTQVICVRIPYYKSIKQDEISWAHSSNGEHQRYIQNFGGETIWKERNFENQEGHETVILKRILEKYIVSATGGWNWLRIVFIGGFGS